MLQTIQSPRLREVSRKAAVSCTFALIFCHLIVSAFTGSMELPFKLFMHGIMFLSYLTIPFIFGQKTSLEGKLLLAYAIWVLASKAILGCFFADLHYSVEYSLSAAVAFFAGICLERPAREKVFIGFTWAYSIFLCIIGGMVLICILGRIEELSLLGLSVWNKANADNFTEIMIFHTHRNMTMPLFMMASALLCWLWTKNKNMLVRAYIVLALIEYYLVLSLAHSRTSVITYSAMVAVFVFLVLMERKPSRKLGIQAVYCFLAAVMMVGCFLLSSQVDVLTGKLVNHLAQPAQTEAVAAAGEAEAQAADSVYNADTRDFLENATNLTGRTIIWENGIHKIHTNPEILLFGQPRATAMDFDYTIPGTFRAYHMHNVLFQPLLYDGLIGFLLIAAFLLCLIYRVLHLCFDTRRGVPLGDKLLTLTAVSCLVVGITEPVFAANTNAMSIVAVFIIGHMAAADREHQ